MQTREHSKAAVHVLRELRERGANGLHVHAARGWNAWHVVAAERLTDPDLHAFVRTTEADCRAEDVEGSTPLYLAVMAGQVETVKAVLDACPDEDALAPFQV